MSLRSDAPSSFRFPPPTLRILVVADYPLARAGLAALLGGLDDLLVVGQATADAAWSTVIDDLAPDVVVLDLAAADEEALERLERGLAARPGLATVALMAGAQADGDTLAEVLGAGARGYLPREASGEELAAAIRAAAAGFLVLSPALAAPLLERALDRPRPAAAGLEEPLTPREREVLQALAGGLTNRAIARRLNVSENTVKFHVSSILTKLDAASRAEAVALAARRGLLLL